MRFLGTLWAAALPTVSAFYPYYSENVGNGSNGKRGLSGALRTPTSYNGRSITLPLRRVDTIQDDIYKILKSNDPTKKNSVPIDQDGRDLSYWLLCHLETAKRSISCC